MVSRPPASGPPLFYRVGTSGVQVSVLGGGGEGPMAKGSFLLQAMPPPLPGPELQ